MRPLRNLKEILGQESAVKLLRLALQRKRLAHAYLFSGPYGVGKKTTAKAFIYHLFCQINSEDPCGSCPACKKLDRLSHEDLLVLEPEKREIKIGQIRALEKELHYRPLSAPYKVVLIKSAERLNPEAGNALLKSLEEPPEYVLFILLAENTSRLLPTILSRTQLVRFKPLPKGLIQECLQRTFGFEPAYAETLAELSMGSLGLALEIGQQGLLEDLHAFVSAGNQENPTAKFRLAERLAKLFPEEQRKFLTLLYFWILRSYLKRKLNSYYPQGLPNLVFQGDPFAAVSLLHLAEEALDSYVPAELTFNYLIRELFPKA